MEKSHQTCVVVFRAGRIGFIGAGSIATAIIKSLVELGNVNVVASRRSTYELEKLHETYGIETTTDNRYVAATSDTLVLCVKPQILDDVVRELDSITADRILSIAAGKNIKRLEELLPGRKIIRCMPTVGILYASGVTVYALNQLCNESEATVVEYVFGGDDKVFKIDEEAMNAATVPACYIGLLARQLGAIEQVLVQQGLGEMTARKLLIGSLCTEAQLVMTGMSFVEIYRRVASPGGATEAAQKKSEELKIYDALQQAAIAAIERCEKLGGKK